MLPPPPTPTLFPYTTLFRSGHVRPERVGAQVHVTSGAAKVPPALVRGRDHRSERRIGPQDRKSTRLNSSHGYISYAVFCLKKKNTRRRQGYTHHRCRRRVRR